MTEVSRCSRRPGSQRQREADHLGMLIFLMHRSAHLRRAVRGDLCGAVPAPGGGGESVAGAAFVDRDHQYGGAADLERRCRADGRGGARGSARLAKWLLVGAIALGAGVPRDQVHRIRARYRTGWYRACRRPSSTAARTRYSWTLYFAATGLHALHVVAGLTLLGVADLAVRPGAARSFRCLLRAMRLNRHLVDVIWVFLIRRCTWRDEGRRAPSLFRGRRCSTLLALTIAASFAPLGRCFRSSPTGSPSPRPPSSCGYSWSCGRARDCNGWRLLRASSGPQSCSFCCLRTSSPAAGRRSPGIEPFVSFVGT